MELALKDLMDRGYVVEETDFDLMYNIGRRVDGKVETIGHTLVTIVGLF